MASVPNMNVFPSVPATGAPAPAEGEGGEVFANLLPTVAPGTILNGPPVPGAVLAQDAATQIRAALPDGEATEDGEAGDTADAKDAIAADGSDDAIAALFAQVEFVPIVQTPKPVPPVAVTTPVPTPPSNETARIVPDAQAAPLRLVTPGVPMTVQAPIDAATEVTAPASESSSETPTPARAIEAAAKSAARGEALPDELVIPVKTLLKQAAAQAPAPAAEVAQKAVTLAAMPIVDGTPERPRGSRASAEKMIAPASPTTLMPTVPSTPAVMPMVAPTDQLAVSQPAQRLDGAPAQPTEQGIEHELDLAHESEWLDRLARDIARSGASDGPMRFKLNPQTLGHLRVELTQGDMGTSVRLTVETDAARALLTDAQPKLIAEARAQGVRIAQTDIDLAGSGHQASGDPRRQDDPRQNILVRTARGSGGETAVAVETGRTRSDRYA